MPDVNKVINGLIIERTCVARDCNRDCGRCDLAQDRDWLLSVYDEAIEILKQREPVESIEMMDDHYPIGDPLRTIGWKCGKCGERIAWNDNYCSKCGTAVKWVE